MNISYEMTMFSYENMDVSYEALFDSCEKGIFSYESPSISYEMEGLSYEIVIIWDEKCAYLGLRCCRDKSVPAAARNLDAV